MHYLESFQYVFKNPKWFTNCLLGGVCFLIPVVGGFVWIGYCFEVIAALHHRKSPEGEYPDFDFNQFLPYLIRGLWVILGQLILSLPIALIASIPATILAVVMSAIHNSVVTAVVTLLLVLLFVAIMVGSMVVLPPVALRGGFTQNFGLIFSVPFLKDFASKMWKESLLGGLFLIAVSIPLTLVGLLACCVGLYFTQALACMVQMHMYYQLYELYLQRGGEAIPEAVTMR